MVTPVLCSTYWVSRVYTIQITLTHPPDEQISCAAVQGIMQSRENIDPKLWEKAWKEGLIWDSLQAWVRQDSSTGSCRESHNR